MIPHNPPRTATEGSGTEDTSGLSSDALSAQVVAARATIKYNLEDKNFIQPEWRTQKHVLPQHSTSLSPDRIKS